MKQRQGEKRARRWHDFRFGLVWKRFIFHHRFHYNILFPLLQDFRYELVLHCTFRWCRRSDRSCVRRSGGIWRDFLCADPRHIEKTGAGAGDYGYIGGLSQRIKPFRWIVSQIQKPAADHHQTEPSHNRHEHGDSSHSFHFPDQRSKTCSLARKSLVRQVFLCYTNVG